MSIQPQTRRAGGVGAMMDEYERAVAELSTLVSSLSDADFEAYRDHIEWTRRKYEARDLGKPVPIR